MNIALVNELAMFAADLGIDVWEAIDAASTKPFGYLRFTPGPGVGGHCLPVDPSYLSLAGEAPPRPELPVRGAGQRRERAHARLRRAAALQRAQRPGQGRSRAAASCCSACRSRPTWATGARARATGWPTCSPSLGADLRAADPHVAPDRFPPGTTPVECTAEELAAADAVVLLVDHAAFDPDVILAHAALRARHQGPPAASPERRAPVGGRGVIVKRGLDVFVAIAALLVLIVPMAAIAIVVASSRRTRAVPTDAARTARASPSSS